MDVPADIRETAGRIATKANECCYRTDGYEDDIRHYIALALMAERERCAQIAEQSRCDTSGDKRRAQAIADAIRA